MGSTGIWWAEARNDAEHPVVHRTAPHNRELRSPDVSVGLRLRNPHVKQNLPVSKPYSYTRAPKAPIWSVNLLFLSVNRQPGTARCVKKDCSVREKSQSSRKITETTKENFKKNKTSLQAIS